MGCELPERLDRDALRATLRFLALVAVLPVLPGGELDALFGLDPRRIWLIVVFVAGLSYLGYLLSTIVDPAAAIGITGALGGCVSPGMTIASLVERARRTPAPSPAYAFAAAVAVTMLFPRNLVVVGIVSASLARSLALPFAAMTGVSVAMAGWQWSRVRTDGTSADEPDAPFRVRSALAIGAVVAAILIVVDALGLSLPSDATRLGVVLLTVAEVVGYVGVSWTAGAREVARALAAILLGSAGLGVALVLLT